MLHLCKMAVLSTTWSWMPVALYKGILIGF